MGVSARNTDNVKAKTYITEATEAIAAAVALGFFGAFAAMFGFDKFRQMLEQIAKLKR